MQTLCALVRAAIAERLSSDFENPILPEQIRLPARGADAGCAAALTCGLDANAWAEKLHAARDSFPTVLGAPLIAKVHSRNGWLLFDFDAAFYSAAVSALAVCEEDIPADHEIYPLHRLRMLARYPSPGCPDDPSVHRAVLLALAANESPTAANRARAEEAILTMAHHLPPADRAALLRRCGGVARAVAGLLYGSGSRK